MKTRERNTQRDKVRGKQKEKEEIKGVQDRYDYLAYLKMGNPMTMEKRKLLNNVFRPQKELQTNNDFIDGVSHINGSERRNTTNAGYNFASKTLKIKGRSALNINI